MCGARIAGGHRRMEHSHRNGAEAEDVRPLIAGLGGGGEGAAAGGTRYLCAAGGKQAGFLWQET